MRINKAWRRVRIARTTDPSALRAVLAAQSQTTRIALVFQDGSRCAVARCLDEGALHRLIEAMRPSTNARLELVLAEDFEGETVKQIPARNPEAALYKAAQAGRRH